MVDAASWSVVLCSWPARSSRIGQASAACAAGVLAVQGTLCHVGPFQQDAQHRAVQLGITHPGVQPVQPGSVGQRRREEEGQRILHLGVTGIGPLPLSGVDLLTQLQVSGSVGLQQVLLTRLDEAAGDVPVGLVGHRRVLGGEVPGGSLEVGVRSGRTGRGGPAR